MGHFFVLDEHSFSSDYSYALSTGNYGSSCLRFLLVSLVSSPVFSVSPTDLFRAPCTTTERGGTTDADSNGRPTEVWAIDVLVPLST